MKKIALLSALVGITASVSVQAEDASSPKAPFVVGLGGLYSTSVYKDVDSRSQVVPVLFGSIGKFRFEGRKVSYELFKRDQWTLSPIISFGFGQGFRQSDIKSGSHLYDGLEERDPSFGAGAELSYKSKLFSSSLSVESDISNNHSGYRVSWALRKNYMLSQQFIVTPSVSATYDSDKVNQYYFGITQQEANELRAQYDAKGGVNFDVGATVTWMPTTKWTVVSGANYVFYNSEVTDSPLVDSDGEALIFFGVGYNF